MFLLAAMPLNTHGQEHAFIPDFWQSPHFQNNPLVGKIYSSKGKLTSTDQLSKVLHSKLFFLFGEIHNNPDHHVIQSKLVTQVANLKSANPDIVFEMVPERLQYVMDKASFSGDPKLEKLGRLLEWEKRGWYDWGNYRPIFTAALRNNLSLKAGNLDRTQTRKISRKGLKSLSTMQLKQLSLGNPLPKQMADSLRNELKLSHCGLLPERALAPMSIVQRARDGAMARALLRAKTRGGILIAGNGHVRKDRGVPRLMQQDNLVVIGLIEVEKSKFSYTDYPLENDQNQALYDYVIYTPKFDISDQCATMRKQFKKLKQKP